MEVCNSPSKPISNMSFSLAPLSKEEFFKSFENPESAIDEKHRELKDLLDQICSDLAEGTPIKVSNVKRQIMTTTVFFITLGGESRRERQMYLIDPLYRVIRYLENPDS